MDREIVDAVTEWDKTACASGYEGLHELASRSFSGAITPGGIWAFMLNGRVIGLVGGSLSAFDGSDLTAYVAPDPAVALLYTMQSSDREKEAAYYTNRTPISEVDQTLSAGGFSGYIELSENVHSGDYYIVYYGGKSMSVAFVGNQRRLLTEDEAFRRADDEVGIYDVYAVDIDVTPLPEFESSTPSAAAVSEPESTENEHDIGDDAGDEQAALDSAETDEHAEEVQAVKDEDNEPEDDPDDSGIIMGIPDTGFREEDDASDESADVEDDAENLQSATDEAQPLAVEDDDESMAVVDEETPPDDVDESAAADDDDEPLSVTDTGEEPTVIDANTADAVDDTDSADTNVDTTDSQQSAATPAAADEPIASLQAELASAKREINQLKQQIADGTHTKSPAQPTQTLSVEEALAGANLFVRYDSKGRPTLETVHDTAADPVDAEEVIENLRIDHHTTFDSENTVVSGQPFATMLADRIEMGFVDWLVRKLPFEIRDTRNQNALGAVYDAFPEIDRVELRGEVVLGVDDEGGTITKTFDMVVRNKMGDPLFVVQIEDSPQPIDPSVIEQLIRDGNDLATHTDAFCGVFVVSTSYYGPAALEAVSDATSGGLLSRNKKKAFVSVSRKRGFHVCLTDRLNGEFDLRVPEL